MVTEIELFESGVHCSSLSLFVGLDDGRIYQRNMATGNELLSRILDAAARVKKRKDQLRGTRRDLRPRSAQYIDADGGDFLTFIEKCDKLVISA